MPALLRRLNSETAERAILDLRPPVAVTLLLRLGVDVVAVTEEPSATSAGGGKPAAAAASASCVGREKFPQTMVPFFL